MIDPHTLQREANEVLGAVSSDLMEGRAKDAVRLLQAIVANPLVASLIVQIIDWADKHLQGESRVKSEPLRASLINVKPADRQIVVPDPRHTKT